MRLVPDVNEGKCIWVLINEARTMATDLDHIKGDTRLPLAQFRIRLRPLSQKEADKY